MKLLIIADDFTGALDTGVKFAAAGISTKVVTDFSLDFLEDQEDVVVVDSESRHLQSQDAYQRIYDIVKRAGAAKISYIYKKTDSALRGNIGSELTAALDASGESSMHFVPAFPEMGRTTIDGIHYIQGIPVHKSVFGSDPFNQVRFSKISDIIHEQSQIAVHLVHKGMRVEDKAYSGIYVYDADNDGDMKRIAENLIQANVRVMAGCAGMAQMLSALIHFPRISAKSPVLVPRLLIVCGSVNEITRKQMDYLEKKGVPRIRLSLEQKLEEHYFETAKGQKELEEMLQEHQSDTVCMIDSNDKDPTISTLQYAGRYQIDLEEMRKRISENLGGIADFWARQDCTLMIIGGDTVQGFAVKAHLRQIIPIEEIAAGSVLSQIITDKKRLYLISKSGGFGEETLLEEIAEKITQGVGNK